MPTRYDPKDHIQPLAIAPKAEGILDQREITIQSYQTTIPFDFGAIDSGLEAAWLTPVVQLGVFSRGKHLDKRQCNVVLGLQDSLSVRAYDYDERRPLWFSWQNVVVETVNVHYFSDDDGLLRFKVTGGGRRITEDRLCEFNSNFLRIAKEAVTKRHFDLAKLRKLCFGRFSEQLYMVRFADPSAKEYRSIDHALFQSRDYIDPNAERLREIESDKNVKIESFDSDVEVRAKELAGSMRVRFFLRGLSGSLRLRFPNMQYRKAPQTIEEQVQLFYRMVDLTENIVLDEDYYAQLPRSLDELDLELGMFPDCVELAPFRDVLLSKNAMEQFFLNLDFGASWNHWLPHLRALDELLPATNILTNVRPQLHALRKRDARIAVTLLNTCLSDAKLHQLGRVVADVLTNEIHEVPADERAHVEEALLKWAIDQEAESWDVDPESEELVVFNLRWKKTDLALDVLSKMLAKLIGLLHRRLTEEKGDLGCLLRRIHWCTLAAKDIPSNFTGLASALRLIAEGKVPASVAEGAKVLRTPVADLESLDNAVLAQFALPLWPYLTASRENGKIALLNSGLGVARDVQPVRPKTLFSNIESSTAMDLQPGGVIESEATGHPAALDIQFVKYGTIRRISVPIKDVGSPASNGAGVPFTIDDSTLTVTMAGKTAKFSKRSERLFSLIARIGRRPGHRVDFDTLRNPGDLWDGSLVEDSSIRGAVNRLRIALKKAGLGQLAASIVTSSFQGRAYVILNLQQRARGKSN